MEQNKSRLRQLCEVLSAVFTLFAKTRPVAEEVATAATTAVVATATATTATATTAVATATTAVATAATEAVAVGTAAATTFIDEKAQIELRIVQENLHAIEVPITAI